MGQEFGQEREFSEKRELDWNLLDSVDGEMSDNERLRQYVSVLNSFYLAHPAMYELDARPAGFEWISTLDADHSVIAFLRKCKDETLLVVCNFTPVSYDAFRIGVPFAGKYKEIFNSDDKKYGGNGVVNTRVKAAKKAECDEREYSITLKLPALGVAVFTCTPEEIEKNYGMTRVAIRSHVYRNNIPSKKEHGQIFYSKLHFDLSKKTTEDDSSEYYTVQEAMKKYSLTRDSVYGILQFHEIKREKKGRFVRFLKVEFDHIMGAR